MKLSWIQLNPGDGGVLERIPESIEVPSGCTVKQALGLIGLPFEETQGLFDRRAVAVYGVYARPETLLYEGDRIEILDSLKFDPMDSRRRRAKHKSKQQQATGTGKVRQAAGKATPR